LVHSLASKLEKLIKQNVVTSWKWSSPGSTRNVADGPVANNTGRNLKTARLQAEPANHAFLLIELVPKRTPVQSAYNKSKSPLQLNRRRAELRLPNGRSKSPLAQAIGTLSLKFTGVR